MLTVRKPSKTKRPVGRPLTARALMPAQQLQATDANGAVTKEAVIVNISVAALGNAQNIQLYFYNETTHAWELAAVNSVDYATNTINVTMPGNAIFTLVHKN